MHTVVKNNTETYCLLLSNMQNKVINTEQFARRNSGWATYTDTFNNNNNNNSAVDNNGSRKNYTN